MSSSTYLDNLVLQYVVNKTPFVIPAWWLALFTASPGKAGSKAYEVVAGDYGRVQFNWDSNLQNAGLIQWGPTVSTWGDVDYVVVFDSQTSGNVLGFAAVSVGLIVASDVIKINPGGISLVAV